jgi:hypothetical protein
VTRVTPGVTPPISVLSVLFRKVTIQLREKHCCGMCAKPFSRRWNRDRHLKEIHFSEPFSPSFASPRMKYEASRLNFNTSRHLRFHSNSQAHQLDKNPIDRTLEILRKIAEIKRLKEEISFMPNQESYHGFNGLHYGFNEFSSSEANKPLDFLRQPKIEDLEIIGCNGYVCKNCLTASALRIYKDKFNPLSNPIQTGHWCDMERLVEISQRKLDKENVLSDLYTNQLPLEMLRAIREWTANKARLKAVEVSTTVDIGDLITDSNPIRCVSRAIREGVTHLTDEDLWDFISTVKDRTYACGIHVDKMKQDSSKVFFVSIVAGQ